LTTGKIHIDEGAEKALLDRNSLLSVGILQITGEFEAGEVVEIISTKGETIAIARTKIGFPSVQPNHTKNMVAHADDIVLL
jgi:glutamate 5-kinase